MLRSSVLIALICVVGGSWGVYTPQVEAVGVSQQQTAFVGPPSYAPLQYRLRCSRQQQQQQQQLGAARRPFVGGNWKCNGTVKGAETILQMLNDAPAEVDDVEVSPKP